MEELLRSVPAEYHGVFWVFLVGTTGAGLALLLLWRGANKALDLIFPPAPKQVQHEIHADSSAVTMALDLGRQAMSGLEEVRKENTKLRQCVSRLQAEQASAIRRIRQLETQIRELGHEPRK